MLDIQTLLIAIPEGHQYVRIVGQKDILDMLKFTDITSAKVIPYADKYNTIIIHEEVESK